jgi:hypothetical protein
MPEVTPVPALAGGLKLKVDFEIGDKHGQAGEHDRQETQHPNSVGR